MEDKALTGYPSTDRPWLKYYSEEAINSSLPEYTIYEYFYENNKDYPNDIALEYMGNKITYGKMFSHIDNCEKSLTALGVKPGNIVTVALPSIPEALYLIYALNKMGAVANMIHPLAGENEIVHYLNEVSCNVAVLFEGTYNIVKNSLYSTSLKKAVVVSAGDSLPFAIKQLYMLKNKLPKFTADGMLMNWKQFIGLGYDTTAVPVKKDSSTMAIISHTGGTTGEPKGVMLSDSNINALMWQLNVNFKNQRQEKNLVVLPPFVNYSLVHSMLLPLTLGLQVTLIPKYEADKFDEYVRKYKPSNY